MQNGLMLIAITIIFILAAGTTCFALSADEAIAIVSVQNNYLLTGEKATAAKNTVTYKGTEYIIVAAKKGETVACYIPVNTKTSQVASMDIEVRDLVKTTIVYTKISELRENTTPANWLLGYTTKNYFFDLTTDFSQMTGSLITVKTELEKINTIEATDLATIAENTAQRLELISEESKKIAEQTEEGRIFEEKYLTNPDTNQTNKYETKYSELFAALEEYKKDFDTIQKAINELNTGIGALETTTIEQKRSLQSLLALPTNPRKLPSFFSQTDQLRTIIENIFTQAKNSDSYATTLASRKTRNEAWRIMYGQNEKLIKIDSSFATLEKAAETILSEDNIELWKNQNAVDELTANWNAAKTRFNNSEFEKAKEFAKKAETNVQQIIDEGLLPTEQPINQGLITNVIIALAILLVGLFIYEKYAKKKKNKEEEYDEP
jgi:hypothetical protein